MYSSSTPSAASSHRKEVPLDRSPARPSLRDRAAHAVLRLRRRPLSYWLLALAASSITAAVAMSQLAALAEERERFGVMVSVPVAAVPLAVGATVGAGDISHEMRPKAFLPAAEVAAIFEGRTVATALAEGEIVLEHRLSNGEDRSLTALAPPGHRVLAIPVGDAALPLQPGDRVEIVRTTDVFGIDAAAATIGIGTIVETTESRVSVGIPAALVGDVVSGVHTGTIELALIKPGELDG